MIERIQKVRTCGFRISEMDAFVIGVVLIGVIVLKRLANPLWWILAVAVGHFFIFCNLFRVRRSFELAWAALFVINVTAWLCSEKLEWTNVLTCQLPITVGFIFAELRSPRYHGVFARSLNSRLTDYLERRTL